jgi:hypothetical protein
VNILLLLSVLASLHPTADFEKHQGDAMRVARAIETVVEEAHDPVFGDLATDEATLLQTAWAESRFDLKAVGDGGKSRTPFQLQGLRDDQASDLETATRIAYDRIRHSVRMCGRGRELAEYAGGACKLPRAVRVSRQRMAEARRIVEIARQVIP